MAEISRRTALKAGAALLGAGGLALLGIHPEIVQAAGNVVALNYDESNGDGNLPGQRRQVVDYLRTVDGKGAAATEADLIQAIQGVQKEAASAGAHTFADVESIDFSKVPPGSTWLTWVSNRDNIAACPSDVQLPFGLPGLTFPNLNGQVMIVHAFDPRVPKRQITQLSCKPGIPQQERIWAVAVK